MQTMNRAEAGTWSLYACYRKRELEYTITNLVRGNRCEVVINLERTDVLLS